MTKAIRFPGMGEAGWPGCNPFPTWAFETMTNTKLITTNTLFFNTIRKMLVVIIGKPSHGSKEPPPANATKGTLLLVLESNKMVQLSVPPLKWKYSIYQGISIPAQQSGQLTNGSAPPYHSPVCPNRTTRKPRLLLREVGGACIRLLTLERVASRFQAPPRKTREGLLSGPSSCTRPASW